MKIKPSFVDNLNPGFISHEMGIGKHIRAARDATDLTQDDVGEWFGITGQAVSQWERDETVPEIEKIVELARRLGVPIARLLTGNDDPMNGLPPELIYLWKELKTEDKREQAISVLRALTGRAA